jgi:hypothetical protein
MVLDVGARAPPPGAAPAAALSQAVASSRPAPSHHQRPANPVPIVRETGAQIPAGEVYGSRDLYGDLYADGNFYGPNCTAADNCSEQVTVTTVVPGTLAQIMAEVPDATPSDSSALPRRSA